MGINGHLDLTSRCRGGSGEIAARVEGHKRVSGEESVADKAPAFHYNESGVICQSGEATLQKRSFVQHGKER